METEMYCYLENKERRVLPSGTSNSADGSTSGSTPPRRQWPASTCTAATSDPRMS